MDKIYKCDYCRAVTTNPHHMHALVSFYDDDDNLDEREWPFTLCPECFSNWYEGRVSLKRLAGVCNKNIYGGKPFTLPADSQRRFKRKFPDSFGRIDNVSF